MKALLKKLKIFSCPECRMKRFSSLKNLKIHFGKVHSELKYEINIDSRGRAYIRITSKPIIIKSKFN